MTKFSANKGFTLIELLVVIAIIGLLASVVLVALNSSRVKARDTRRKADLKQITTALNLYLSDNGKYPTAGACAYGANCYVNSTDSTMWIPGLSPYASKLPQDPLNVGGSPWNAGGYTYSYGNVTSDGQSYDLTAQLENTSDPDRCGVKDYLFFFNSVLHWCTNFGGSYSNQIYEFSPP